jgi:DNA-binding CsgD family transcriptional regulator
MAAPVNSDIALAQEIQREIGQELAEIARSLDSILTIGGLSPDVRSLFRTLRLDLSRLHTRLRDEIFNLEDFSGFVHQLHRDRSLSAPSRLESAPPNQQLKELTATERAILDLMATGATTSEIARSRHNSEATIKSHLTSIYRKLGVRNRVEAVRLLHL